METDVIDAANGTPSYVAEKLLERYVKRGGVGAGPKIRSAPTTPIRRLGAAPGSTGRRQPHPRHESEIMLRNSLRCLRGLPAWGSKISGDSWLWLNFGEPHLFTWEASEEDAKGVLSRRLVSVDGDFQLWLQFCRWKVLEGKRIRFHSDQRGMTLLRAGHFLEGRKLIGVKVSLKPFIFAFEFEGATLAMRPHTKADSLDPMWHLSTRSDPLKLRCEAGGQFRYGPRLKPKVVKLQALHTCI
jgi:hypothetical protein